MTEPGDLSPERVAELERQLSDAAAQVAKVQAELAQAKAGEANGVPYGEPLPTAVEPLAEPPRRVPLSYPIALFVFFPWLVPGVFIAGVLAIAVVRGRRYVRRAGLLEWGKVATVTNADEISRGTYYSGTTYTNMRVRQATGWVATTRWYSGPASKTEINFRVDDADGTLTLRGLPYANGVILADPRNLKRALCVSSFPFSVQPGADGEIVDHGLSPWSWMGIGSTIIVHVALLAGAWYAVDGLWFDLPG